MARSTRKSDSYGGGGGGAWDDVNKYNPVGVRSITIRHGNHVDSLQVTYLLADGSTYMAPKHGGTGGSQSSFTLAQDEMIMLKGKPTIP